MTRSVQSQLELSERRHWPGTQRNGWLELTWDSHMEGNLALLSAGDGRAFEADLLHNFVCWFGGFFGFL